MNSVKLAKVTAVHPGRNAVDIIDLGTGNASTNVPVVSLGASTNTGFSGIPEPSDVNAGASEASLTGDRDIIAVVLSFSGLDMVVGFFYPEICQMLFDDKNRSIWRSPSDVYVTVDGEGNTELYHPSGTFFRIGTSSAHEDLTAQDHDGKWKIEKNTAAAVNLHLEVANGGAKQASLDIDSNGNTVLDTRGTLVGTIDGNTDITTPQVTLTTDLLHVTGDLQVDGQTTSVGNIHSDGEVSDGVRSMSGDRTIYNSHTHNDPQGSIVGTPNQTQ